MRLQKKAHVVEADNTRFDYSEQPSAEISSVPQYPDKKQKSLE
jgi:hypothetical protein